MKTSKNFKMINEIFALSFLLASILFLASCQKEESAQPSSDQKGSDELRQSPSAKTFTMINIDHFAARSRIADYSVTVQSNGAVTFEGRRNVAVKGTKEFMVSSETVKLLNDLFLKSGFFNMKGSVVNDADIPFVSTTFNSSYLGRIKTLRDNLESPRELINLRMKAEDILQISKYLVIQDPAPAHTQEVVF